MLDLFLILALLEPPPDATDHIVATDRPDFANSSLTVPRGGWQLEIGMNAGLLRVAKHPLPLGIPTTLRVGITNRFELRLFDSETAEWISPFNNVEPRESFGGKLRLVDDDPDRWTPAVALQPLFLVGLRRDVLPAGELTLIVSQPLGHRVMLDTNFGLEYEIGSPVSRAWEGLVAGSVSVQLHARAVLYSELYVTGTPYFSPTLRWGGDGGFIFVLTRHLAVDVAARLERYGHRTASSVLTGLTALLVPPCPIGKGRASKRAICRARPARPEPLPPPEMVH
jgi:hypothetical protein